MRRRSPIVAALLLVVLTPACGVSGLSFVQDDRVTITAPGDRASVTLPMTLRWTARDFDGTYAVFVDRAPVPPGRTLAWLARDDEVCKETEGCPGAAWFRDRDVYPTSETSLTLEELPDLGGDEDRREFHEASVVLLDERGRRIGESAFTVEFQVVRREGDRR